MVPPHDLRSVTDRWACGPVMASHCPRRPFRLRPADGFSHRLAEVGFRRFLEFAENHRRDFRRSERFAIDVHFDQFFLAAHDLVGDQLFFRLDFRVPTTHEPLDGIDRASRIGDRLPLGRVTDQTVSLIREGHNRRSQMIPFLIGNDFDFAVLFDDGHDRVSGTEVDTDNFFFSHVRNPFLASAYLNQMGRALGICSPENMLAAIADCSW